MDFLQQQRLDDLFFEADALIKEKKITEAISTLEIILVEAPDYGKAYNHLGWIYETQYRDYTKAEDFYKRCIALDPNYSPCYFNLSIALSTLGKHQEQLDLLQQALQVPGIDRASMHNEMAMAFELLCRFDEAIKGYKEAVRYSLIDANITTYMASIERCRTKKTIFEQ
jgi:tetratricopeptide (TPR) repeat protein